MFSWYKLLSFGQKYCQLCEMMNLQKMSKFMAFMTTKIDKWIFFNLQDEDLFCYQLGMWIFPEWTPEEEKIKKYDKNIFFS